MRSGYSVALRARKRVGSSSARLTPVRAGQGDDACVAAPWVSVSMTRRYAQRGANAAHAA